MEFTFKEHTWSNQKHTESMSKVYELNAITLTDLEESYRKKYPDKRIGFKGFGKDMTNRGFQYEVGKVYKKEDPGRPLKTCSTDGYHFCINLQEVNEWYSFNNINNSFGVIEYGDNFTRESKNKCISTQIKILELIPRDKISKAKLTSFPFELIQSIYEQIPTAIIGGSVGLALQGYILPRLSDIWSKPRSYSLGCDLDILLPYNVEFDLEMQKSPNITHCSQDRKRPQSSDFGRQYNLSTTTMSINVDIKIDPEARYTHVKHEGHLYRVVPHYQILQYKAMYADRGNTKHQEDIDQLLVEGL